MKERLRNAGRTVIRTLRRTGGPPIAKLRELTIDNRFGDDTFGMPSAKNTFGGGTSTFKSTGAKSATAALIARSAAGSGAAAVRGQVDSPADRANAVLAALQDQLKRANPSSHDDVAKLLDTIEDVGAQLWAIAEETQDHAERLIGGYEQDGWAEEQATMMVRVRDVFGACVVFVVGGGFVPLLVCSSMYAVVFVR